MDEKLRNLLENIDPRKTLDEVENDIMNALNNFNITKNRIDNYDEFKDCLIDFTRSAWRSLLHAPTIFKDDRDFLYTKALEYLKNDYPGNTEITAYEIMESGAEGGTYTVLKNLASSMARMISNDGIKTKVGEYIHNLSFDEQGAASKEYIEKYKDILPSNIFNDQLKFQISFQKVLENHPYMIRKHGNIGY